MNWKFINILISQQAKTCNFKIVTRKLYKLYNCKKNMIGKLTGLLKRLRERTEGIPRINSSFSELGLELSLDLGRGLEGHESLTADISETGYTITYFALPQTASDTFLNPKYRKEIKSSGLLTRLKGRFKVIKREEARKKEKNYQQLPYIKEQEMNFAEVEKSFYFFARVFQDKAASE